MRQSVNDTELMKKIEKMYNEHKTMTEIGMELGMTKNQVVGLVNNGRKHGYNFVQRAPNFWKVKRRNQKGIKVDPVEAHRRRQVQEKSDRVKAAQYKPVRKREEPIDAALKSLYETGVLITRTIMPEEFYGVEGVQLLDIPPGGCKYPVDERNGTHYFCAKPSVEMSYCAEHLKVMWPNKYNK